MASRPVPPKSPPRAGRVVALPTVQYVRDDTHDVSNGRGDTMTAAPAAEPQFTERMQSLTKDLDQIVAFANDIHDRLFGMMPADPTQPKPAGGDLSGELRAQAAKANEALRLLSDIRGQLG